MNLSATISLYAGGPGSGCNPDKGKCGRPSLGLREPRLEKHAPRNREERIRQAGRLDPRQKSLFGPKHERELREAATLQRPSRSRQDAERKIGILKPLIRQLIDTQEPHDELKLAMWRIRNAEEKLHKFALQGVDHNVGAALSALERWKNREV